MNTTKPYMELFDDQGVSQGLWISPELWERVADDVQPILAQASGHEACTAHPAEPAVAEPMADWNTLKEYWDFSYPLESSVTCGHCGAQSEDWQADEPRKFLLKSATFGGLVSFQCVACKARVVKRHFKDEVKIETVPFCE